MADEKKKIKKVKPSKIDRYFILGSKASSFSDSYTGVTVVPGYIGVMLRGKPSTSDILEKAISNHHIEEIDSEKVAKLKSDGWKEYGLHPGGHAENMKFEDGQANDKLKEVKRIISGIKPEKPKEEDSTDEEPEDDEEELDDDEEQDDDDSEEQDDDEDDEPSYKDQLEGKNLDDLKQMVKEHETMPDEKKKGYSSMKKDKLIKLLIKHQNDS